MGTFINQSVVCCLWHVTAAIKNSPEISFQVDLVCLSFLEKQRPLVSFLQRYNPLPYRGKKKKKVCNVRKISYGLNGQHQRFCIQHQHLNDINLFLKINTRLKDKHVHLLEQMYEYFSRCLKPSAEAAGIWMAAIETNEGSLYECFLSSILLLPNKFWGCGNGNERAPLGEAEWGQDCSMEARCKGLASEENLEKK